MSIQSHAIKWGGALTVVFGMAAGAQAREELIQAGMGSWYGEEMAIGWRNGEPIFNKTASGDVFYPGGISAAHKTLPLGMCVLAVVKNTGKKLVVEINDRGPYKKGRIIDFSRGAAEELGFKESGEASVELYPAACPK